MEVEIVNIDNEDYAIIKEINEYVYLVNTNDDNDIIIRKTDNENNIIELDSTEELDKAIKLFSKEA